MEDGVPGEVLVVEHWGLVAVRDASQSVSGGIGAATSTARAPRTQGQVATRLGQPGRHPQVGGLRERMTRFFFMEWY